MIFLNKIVVFLMKISTVSKQRYSKYSAKKTFFEKLLKNATKKFYFVIIEKCKKVHFFDPKKSSKNLKTLEWHFPKKLAKYYLVKLFLKLRNLHFLIKIFLHLMPKKATF